MPILLSCPNGHKLSIADEYAGQKARCGICQAIMDVPGPAAAPFADPSVPMDISEVEEGPPLIVATSGTPDHVEVVEEAAEQPQYRTYDEDIDEPRRPRPIRKKQRPRSVARGAKRGGNLPLNMSLVNLGLGFHYARILILLLCIVLWILAAIIGVVAAASPSSAGLVVFIAVMLIIGMLGVSPLLGLTGSILCAWVPARSGAKVLIIISLALDVLQFPLALVRILAPLNPEVILVVMLFSFLLALASWLLFMLFLRNLCLFLGENTMGEEAQRLLIKGVLLMLAPIFVPVLAGVLHAAAPALGVVIFISISLLVGVIYWLVVSLSFFFEVLNLIASLRQVILSRG